MKLTDRQIGRAALAAAAAGTVLAPLAALSRFATEEGKEDLESGVVRAWAEPAADALRPLLDWGSADTVYLTYGKLWAPILLATVLCAFAVRRRQPAGSQPWGWRLTLAGMVGITVGVLGAYWTPLLEEFFLVVVASMLLAIIGSLVLGIGLLRRGFRPRAAAVVLVVWLPLFVVLSAAVAMGAALLPVLWAWSVAGGQLRREPVSTALPEDVRARTSA